MSQDLRDKKLAIAKTLLRDGLSNIRPKTPDSRISSRPRTTSSGGVIDVTLSRPSSRTGLEPLSTHSHGHIQTTSTSGKQRVNLPELMAARHKRTLNLIADPNSNNLYSMGSEREITSDYYFGGVLPELRHQFSKQSTVKLLASVLKSAMKKALFGCEVNVAICTDASATVLEFLTEGEYVRQAMRGQSTCFECLDQKDIVLQAIARPKSARSTPYITTGETVVYVPLLGRGGGVGIMEIHGLQSDGITNIKNFQRPTAALKAMIAADDFRFQESLKLWRAPGGRSGGAAVNDDPKFNLSNYHVVCGRISLIANEKDGVPYFDGFRYTITWEDGLMEAALTASELLKAYTHTPQSLGCNSDFDLKLAEDLLRVGSSVGEIFETQRIKDVVRELLKSLDVPSLADGDICERALESVGKVINGIRESHILAYDSTKEEGKSIMIKFPIAKVAERALSHAPWQVVEKIMKCENPLKPLIIDDSAALEWVVVEMDLPRQYRWPRDTNLTRFFAAIVRYKKIPRPASAELEVDYFVQMVGAMCHALDILFSKVTRNKRRKELIKEVEVQLYEWR